MGHLRPAGQHPLIQHAGETGDGSAKKISDFWTQEEFHASDLYRMPYGPMGVEYPDVVRPAGPARCRWYRRATGLPPTSPNATGRCSTCSVPTSSRRGTTRGIGAACGALLGAAVTRHPGRGAAGLVILSDPPQELIPGTLVSLYRYFGRPTHTSPLPVRVARWLATQRRRLGDDSSLESRGTSLRGGAAVIAWCFATFLRPGDDPAVVLRESRPVRVGAESSSHWASRSGGGDRGPT